MATLWFTCVKSVSRPRLSLICFPYAGGGVRTYQTWGNQLPSEVEVYAAQLPGRERRLLEEPFTNLFTLINEIKGAIVPLLDRQFAFFGHSMGAKIGFELARSLSRERGVEPIHLFVSGCRAPHLINPDSPIYNLPEAEFMEKLRHLNGTPREVLGNPEMMNLLFPLLRADFEIAETYTFSPGPRLSCPITAFGGLQDTEVTSDQLDSWSELTNGRFSRVMLPGDHFFVNNAHPWLLNMIARELRRNQKIIEPQSAQKSQKELFSDSL